MLHANLCKLTSSKALSGCYYSDMGVRGLLLMRVTVLAQAHAEGTQGGNLN